MYKTMANPIGDADASSSGIPGIGRDDIGAGLPEWVVPVDWRERDVAVDQRALLTD